MANIDLSTTRCIVNTLKMKKVTRAQETAELLAKQATAPVNGVDRSAHEPDRDSR